MSDSYYNTNELAGERLKLAESQARKQEDIVMAFFLARPNTLYTPEQVWHLAFTVRTPLTSVRRAITNLEQAGRLIKTDTMRESQYGKPAHCWVYHQAPQQLRLIT